MIHSRLLLPGAGGHVAFAEYGASDGIPVLFCHGWPSSCTMAELTHEAARELGIRVISPDRPGIRDSSLQRDRRLLDWPPVAGEIMNHLGIGAFRILAVSGGAPYAFAAAWAMPERIRAIAVVSGAPPITELRDQAGLLPLYRWLLAVYRRSPQLLRASFHLARPIASMRSSVKMARNLLGFLQPCDAESLRDSAAFNACFESQRQAWLGSTEGVMLDAQIYALPWGFPLEEVRVPVRLWHGMNDRSFSIGTAEEVAKRLPNCVAHFVENAGHYSLPIRNMRGILADLAGAGGAGNAVDAPA